jgi:protein-S-isoprenylcysteine O-methyltransferase Ste14
MKILIPSIVFTMAVSLLYFFLPGVKEQPWTALRVGGATIALLGYVFVTIARIQLGHSFTVRPEARELVTYGFYARIRNPMYVFLDIMLLGITFAMRAYWLLIVLTILVVIQVVQSQREAKVLEGKFGQRYVDYRNQTWF